MIGSSDGMRGGQEIDIIHILRLRRFVRVRNAKPHPSLGDDFHKTSICVAFIADSVTTKPALLNNPIPLSFPSIRQVELCNYIGFQF